ncbi:DUF2147 domain-containing protein [Helicobacter sp. faydin-H20]|uniref:DUF2147 domain-containing protein n=1 Tax=Helicobacter anatolicus TaxID=2905874 RepID=UPI001E323B83|nr:DUF2147 domain-containing protein [Helicobacter anatolicus]MCE3037410.1 DUF2147 domain-containing protein [Helicobacter anatolicus]
MRFILFCLFLCIGFAKDISGYYLLPKNEKGIESIVRIFKHDQKYYAYGFASKDGKSAGLDVKNPDATLRNREVRGILFVWDLENQENSNKFFNGRIYNYADGKTYYLKGESIDDVLVFKASVDSKGLFGKTLKWKKMTDEEMRDFIDKDVYFDDVQLQLDEKRK